MLIYIIRLKIEYYNYLFINDILLIIHKCSTTILSEIFHNVYLEEPSIIIGDKNYPSESIHSDSENTIHWAKRM